MVIWLTGMSGAGKTTICTALHDLLKPHLPELVLLDGDVIRRAFSQDLGFIESDRKVQIGRIQKLAKILSDQNLIVLVGALYAHPDLLSWNRQNLQPYFEVYVKASMSLLKERDSKGLYGSSAPNVVGVDIPWHEPTHSDLVIDADQLPNPASVAHDIARAVPRLAAKLSEIQQ
ncbi:adenylyl-sulfate kinase [bacterium SCSIO 12827]|nr:adenylyl-sulfate kinase [bacterium SCSIO 12827]